MLICQKPGDLGPANEVGNARIVVTAGRLAQALPDAPLQRQAGIVAQIFFGRTHQVDPVPAVRQRQALAIRLVGRAQAAQAVFPAARQVDHVRVNVDHLGLMIGGPERARDAVVEKLPVALLRVTDPYRIAAGIVA